MHIAVLIDRPYHLMAYLCDMYMCGIDCENMTLGGVTCNLHHRHTGIN